MYLDFDIFCMDKRVFLLILLVLACSKNDSSQEKQAGYLTLNIEQGSDFKADVSINDFSLQISNFASVVLKENISNLPEQIRLPAGYYTVEAYSMEFFEPKFEMPFYYGKTTVDIEPDALNEANLLCALGNAGIKIVWSQDFSEIFSSYQAHIMCNNGYLNYSPTETRTGYFLPGTVNIIIMADGQNIDAGSITIAAQDLVTVNLHPKTTQQGALSVAISIDDTLNEREIDITINPEQPNSETNPYTVAQAIERQGENEVWITGYIVGSKPTTGYDFVNGAWLNTNIVVADNILETSDNNVVFVELSSTSLRNNLALTGANNHERLHRQVLIKGNLRTYQSRAGLRDVTEHLFK